MPVVVVMGVSGSGKTTVGAALADALDVEYAEADAFHPPANIAKMRTGTALTDADRWPWLHATVQWIDTHAEAGGVVSSSALKRAYRDVLARPGNTWFLHLWGAYPLISRRMAARSGHFMPARLLASQFADLEPLQPDEPGRTVDAAAPPDEIVVTALRSLERFQAAGDPDNDGRNCP